MLILASSSPTRASILKNFGIKFKQRSCDFDEDSIACKDAKSFVYQATLGKMKRYKQLFNDDEPFLCADTVLSCNGKILRKAKNISHAKKLLMLQSGNEVSIFTCMIYVSQKFHFFDLSSTVYEFKKFDDDKLNSYLNSNLWQGKAGACMVEGFCKEYIKNKRGLTSTAMGLSIEKLLAFLNEVR